MKRALSALLITSLIALPFAGCSSARQRHIETVGSAADDSELVALNLTDATLPRQVTRTLRALASDNPNALSGCRTVRRSPKDTSALGQTAYSWIAGGLRHWSRSSSCRTEAASLRSAGCTGPPGVESGGVP